MTLPISSSLVVPPSLHGMRADAILAQLLPEFSRSQLSNWLKDGQITVNQHLVKPKEKLSQGDVLYLQINPKAHTETAESKPEDILLHIIYEDDDILVINKPAGLIVHPGAGNPYHTLVNALLYREPSLEQLPRAGIVHRLDKDTTGLLVIAKSLQAYTTLIRQMQERQIQRQYLALVQGHVISGGKITTHFGRHPRQRLKMAVCSKGHEAITYYHLKKQYQIFTLLEITLGTGRTHQIRVHMAHIRHPVVGDPLYGGRHKLPSGSNETLNLALQQFKRQALHAHHLSFYHPIKHEIMEFSAPLPADFENLLTLLDQYEILRSKLGRT